ncbi:DNA-binding protein [Aliihoeflea aestuarii]|jgi:uncharacterized OB-fold protein|uniref:Zn-ribbon domain-containing OB-fold protein n=1 Tax=Aliihoeflea aestuarii TaxID=453840 RepID=UPI0025B3BDC4|nr:OB-fold domain-containing protein [Aliihoeflea aestuarii]MCO6392496.1 DNA-binding protein [Aliihoeflea aestuarii]
MHEGPDVAFRRGLAEGKVVLPKCNACGRFHFFPRVVCPHCYATSFTSHEISGRGEIHTTTVVRRAPDRGGDYNVCIVELEERVRMMSRVEGVAPPDVEIGMAVIAYVGEIDGTPAVLCRPEGG